MEEPKPEELKVAEQETKPQGVETKEQAEDFIVNPYTISSGTDKEIDYNKLIQKFGCFPLTEELVQRIEKYTGKQAHYYIKRGIFFSHRDLDAILTACQTHK